MVISFRNIKMSEIELISIQNFFVFVVISKIAVDFTIFIKKNFNFPVVPIWYNFMWTATEIYYAKMFVKADSLSSKLCKAFNKLQMDDIAVSKAVKHLRKLHENVEDSRFENSKLFFEHLTHLLRLPLSRGSSKDRMCTFDEKVFENVRKTLIRTP